MIVEFFTSGLLGFWLKTAGLNEPHPHKPSIAFPDFALQPTDLKRDQLVKTYVSSLAQQGFAANNQGIWIQTTDDLLANHQGRTLQTPASLTKVATTLAALKTWGPKHQFQTQIQAAGQMLDEGVLQGDLLIQCDGDPLLATSEAIAIGNRLNQLGLRKVTGNLIVGGPLSVNFSQDLVTGGDRLKQIWNSPQWTPEIEQVYGWMPKGTPKPNLLIEGGSQEASPLAQRAGKPLLNHASLPLSDLLKYMNVYSNNHMAEWFADRVGGPEVIRNIAIQTGRLSPKEIILKNGSGLEQKNKLSPRAVVGLFQSIQAELQPHRLTLKNLFPVMGQDKGTVEKRYMPAATVVKTGTLWNTSGLAGMIQTQRYGPVWFAVMNRGEDYTDGFRNAQDRFLQSLVDYWGSDLGSTPLPDPPVADLASIQRHRVLDRFMQNDYLSH
jgi:serine-type D-Ala-D-Ala carboxypeptidase/endopeptidase (penicillin-binding protein 4)